ncbi:MAG: GxxExxY protein [Parcubacteria group bacterium]
MGTRRFDFIILGNNGEVIVLELKVGPFAERDAYEQIYEYLKLSNIKLGLLVLFTSHGVKVKRIVNLY